MKFHWRIFAALVLLATVITVSCTKDELNKWEYIGPEGGTIYSADGKIRIDIPRGAMPSAQKLTIEELAPIGSMQIGPTWRISPGVVLSPGLKATVYIRYASLLEEDSDIVEDSDLAPVLVRGSKLELLSPFEINTTSKSVRVKTEVLSGFALLDWGCSKSCRKRALCGEIEDSFQQDCTTACAESLQTGNPLNEWDVLWCEIASSCENLTCCSNPDAPECMQEESDGDEEVIEGEEEIEVESEFDEILEETDPEPEEDEVADSEESIEEEVELRPFKSARRCFENGDCNTDAGEICFQDQNLCYVLPEDNVRRYSFTEYGYTSVSGDPDVSCIGSQFQATSGPTHTRVTVRISVIGETLDLTDADVSILRQDDWASGTWTILAEGSADADGNAMLPLVPTNESIVIIVRKTGVIQPSAMANVFIPAGLVQSAPPDTGIVVPVYAVSPTTLASYAEYAGLVGGLRHDSGVVWTVVRDCSGYSLANVVGHFWDNEANGILYLSRNLMPQPYLTHTEPSGHVVFFELPQSTQQIRFAGRTGENSEPAVIAREYVPIYPEFVVFIETNRTGWELSPK